jgi:hypothetical protein
MSQPEDQRSDPDELEVETIADLEVDDPDAADVRGGPKNTCQYSNGPIDHQV